MPQATRFYNGMLSNDMGTYCSIKFDDIVIMSVKSVIPDFFVSMFLEADRRTKYDAANGEEITTYVASRKIILERLDLQGFTSAASRKSFDRWLKDQREMFAEWNRNDPTEWYEKELLLLQRFDFEEWRSRLRSALKSRYSRNKNHLDDIGERMVEHDGGWLFWEADVHLVLRMMLDELTEIKNIVLDTADLISEDYVDGSPGLLDRIRAEAALSRPELDPIVIIGEGVGDTAVLRASLPALYPKMADYFSFFDHSELSVDGGASYLVKFLRAFGAARIATRVIAVFDNDAAGSDAFDEAKKLPLPSNIVPFKLPDIKLARAYPTTGPQGAHVVDVNGKAAGIELYLGKRSLICKDKKLSPVEWSGPVGKSRIYQGAVRDKARVMDVFLNEIREPMPPSGRRKRYPELVILWKALFEVVQTLNASEVIQRDKNFDDTF